MKSLMKTRKQKETGEKEVHLLEQKGYEKMVNEDCSRSTGGSISQADS